VTNSQNYVINPANLTLSGTNFRSPATNPGGNLLLNYTGDTAPGLKTAYDFTLGSIDPAKATLASGLGPAIGTVGNYAAGNAFNPGAILGNPGSNVLGEYASGGAYNPLAAVSGNPGSDTLRKFASGGEIAPLLSKVAQATLAWPTDFDRNRWPTSIGMPSGHHRNARRGLHFALPGEPYGSRLRRNP
jgi:hypothetical protein